MDEFERDLNENKKAVEGAREALLGRLRRLGDQDLLRVRRGGWSVQEVLRHVIDAEVSYTRVVAHLRGLPLQVADPLAEDVASIGASIAALERYRTTLMASVEGVDEATFYEMRTLGREQYSVMSVLENVADHDHEHLGQIAKTVGA